MPLKLSPRRMYSPNRTWYRFRHALAAVEDLFVGKAYADTLPAGMALSFYHGDHLGSVNLITDHAGAQVELAEHTPFGATSRLEKTNSSSNPLKLRAS